MVFICIFKFLAQIVDIFSELTYLKPKFMIIHFLFLDLNSKFIAFRLEHWNDFILDLTFSIFHLFACSPLCLFFNFELLLLGEILSLNELSFYIKG